MNRKAMAFILAFLLIGAGGGSLLHDFLEQRHMERAVVRVMRQIAHQPERELMREQKHEEIEEIRQEGLAKAVDVLGRVGCRFWGEQYQSAPTMRSAVMRVRYCVLSNAEKISKISRRIAPKRHLASS